MASSDLTSLQPIGDAVLLVEYCVEQVNGRPNVTVNGAFDGGESGGFIEASCFSEKQLRAWEAAIRLEVLDDCDQRNTLYRAAGRANSRRFDAEPQLLTGWGALA